MPSERRACPDRIVHVFLVCSESDLGAFEALQCNTTFRFEHGLHGVIGFEQYTWGCRVRIPYDRNCKTSTRRSEGLAVEHGIRAQATSIVNSAPPTTSTKHPAVTVAEAAPWTNGSAGLGRGSPKDQGIRRIGQGPLGLLSTSARERERPSPVDLVEPDIDHQSTHQTRSLAKNACPAGEFAKGDPTQPLPISGCKHCPAGRYSDKPAATVQFVSHFADVCLVWFCLRCPSCDGI